MRTEPTITFSAAACCTGCAATSAACCFGAAASLLLQHSGSPRQRPCRLKLRRRHCSGPCAPAARGAAAVAFLVQAPAADIAADASRELRCAIRGEYEVSKGSHIEGDCRPKHCRPGHRKSRQGQAR